jgi:hypothetical protein
MAQSVGMFQRPVEYKINCLELVYEFSGLNFSYTDLYLDTHHQGSGPAISFGPLNFSYSMAYSGVANLSLCFVKKDGLPSIKVHPTYTVNTVHSVELFDRSDSASVNVNRIYEAHATAISSFNARLNFYAAMKEWIKFKLVEGGMDPEKVATYNIFFEFIDYYANKFYLASGTNYYRNGVNTNMLIPVGTDDFGRTLWNFPGAGVFNEALMVNHVFTDDARAFYHDSLAYEGDGNILSSDYYSDIFRSEESINNYFNYYKAIA